MSRACTLLSYLVSVGLVSAALSSCGDSALVVEEPRALEAQEVESLSQDTFATRGADEVTTRAIASSHTPPHQFWLGGQQAWFHDNGFSYGFFHTYDGLKACGQADAARKVHVLLPRDYEQRRRRWPVVYMQDGDTTFWPGGAANKSWRAAQTLSELAARGQLQPVILVAVHPLDREREYTHASWAPGRAYGGAQAYTDYLADCVKPFIDAHYHTDPAAAVTAVVGSSHGGLISFYAGTRRPDRFGKIGALSPSFWAGLDSLATGWLADEDRRDLAGLSRSALVSPARALLSSSARPTLWIDWGLRRQDGFHNQIIEKLATKRGKDMVALLEREHGYQVGRDLFWHEDPVGGHDEDAWAYRFGLMMTSLYPAR